MIIVADSGPLHYLVLLDQADLLRRFYQRVTVPDAVIEELSVPGSPPVVRRWVAAPPSWVEIAPVGRDAIETVTDRLDRGERAAIALAMRLGADLLLVDDAAGRTEARRLNLRVTGTLGVLRVGAEHGLLDVPKLLARLRATTFYADEKVLLAIFGRWLHFVLERYSKSSLIFCWVSSSPDSSRSPAAQISSERNAMARNLLDHRNPDSESQNERRRIEAKWCRSCRRCRGDYVSENKPRVAIGCPAQPDMIQ